jgi:hypothetical protein
MIKYFFSFFVTLVCMSQSHIVKAPHIHIWHIFLSYWARSRSQDWDPGCNDPWIWKICFIIMKCFYDLFKEVARGGGEWTRVLSISFIFSFSPLYRWATAAPPFLWSLLQSAISLASTVSTIKYFYFGNFGQNWFINLTSQTTCKVCGQEMTIKCILAVCKQDLEPILWNQ